MLYCARSLKIKHQHFLIKKKISDDNNNKNMKKKYNQKIHKAKSIYFLRDKTQRKDLKLSFDFTWNNRVLLKLRDD